MNRNTTHSIWDNPGITFKSLIRTLNFNAYIFLKELDITFIYSQIIYKKIFLSTDNAIISYIYIYNYKSININNIIYLLTNMV